MRPAAGEFVNTSVNVGSGIAVLVLVSLGLAIVFGVMGVINLAHGEFVMIGAFTTVTLVHTGLPLVLAMLAAPVASTALGIVVEVLLVRRLYGGALEGTLLATFGVSMVVQQLAVLVFGSSPQGIGTPLGSFQVGDYAIGWYQLVLIAAAVLLVLAVVLLFSRTGYGLLARAAMQNRAMAANLGVDTRRVNTVTFAVGAALAGAAGALLSPVVAVVPTMGVPLISSAFLSVVLGGPAVVTGAVTAAAVLGGVREGVAVASTPVLGSAALLLTAVVLLRVLPRGISDRFGRDV